jgi:hypothetical protein
MGNVPLNVQIVAAALIRAGEEANLAEIYREVAHLIPDWAALYKNEESFRGTVRATIEEYCPQSEKYMAANEALFERVGRGRYRLVYPADRQAVIARSVSR